MAKRNLELKSEKKYNKNEMKIGFGMQIECIREK